MTSITIIKWSWSWNDHDGQDHYQSHHDQKATMVRSDPGECWGGLCLVCKPRWTLLEKHIWLYDGYKKKEDDGGENFVGGGDHVNEYGDDEGICFYSIFLR